MASLKQNIKTLLTDVERFLAETLKHVKLDRAAVSSKEKLLERVRQLLDDVMGPSNSSTQLDGINASGGSFVTSGGSSDSSSSNLQHSTSEEPSYSDDISKIASSELKDVFQAGLLDKKKKSGLKTWEQMYCVVSKNIFYLYKKQSDSKQKEAFCLTGYEFHEAPSLEKDANKKEMCFELTKVGSSTYQFRAASKDAVLIWKEAINKGISTVVDTHVIGEGPQENYEDVEEKSQENDLPPPPKEMIEELEEENPDDIYEECGEGLQAQVAQLSASFPPPPAEEEGELYEEGFSPITDEEVLQAKKATQGAEEPALFPPPPPPLSSLPQGKAGRREPPPPPPPVSDPPPRLPPKAELPPIPVGEPSTKKGSVSERPPPPVPSVPPPLPDRAATPLRVPQLRTPFMDRDEDFENLYYGRWDCEKDCNKELTFKKGDIIHVLSKDFDSESWWVGELDGRIGLVPKDYLFPAFQLVA